MGARRRVEELLKPGGEVIGERPRPNSKVRRVAVDSPAEEARQLFDQLAELGHDHPGVGSRPGRLVEMPGLGYVGHRETPTPTVDVNVNIEGLRNVKFKFVESV